jgi:hypothetical protein
MVLYAYQVMEVMLHKQEKLSGSWNAAQMGNLSHVQSLRGGFHRPVNYTFPTWNAVLWIVCDTGRCNFFCDMHDCATCMSYMTPICPWWIHLI